MATRGKGPYGRGRQNHTSRSSDTSKNQSSRSSGTAKSHSSRSSGTAKSQSSRSSGVEKSRGSRGSGVSKSQGSRGSGVSKSQGSRASGVSNYEGVRSTIDGSNRAVVVLVLFLAIAFVFLARLLYLQVFVSEDYSAEAQTARTANIEISPRRGTIYDRNGTVLATSVDATTIYVNPYEVTNIQGEAAQLAAILGGDISSYAAKLSTKDISFVYIERKADVNKAEKVKELGLDGVYFIADTKRVYPNDQIGGQVIGCVDIDGNGISGLELYYDEILKGSAGTLIVERGAYGIPIPGGVHQETPAENGQDIIISLDLGMQEYLEKRLEQGVKDIEGKGGNSVIMDASNGEILACASLPYFNPSDTSTVEEGATQLKSITDSFEPGSIFKAISVSAILEEGSMSPDDTLFAPSVLYADGYYISDAHDRADQTMSLRQILDKSSNVGMALATEQMGFHQLYLKIINYKLTETTGVDYPGESSGYLADYDDWSLIQSYNVSFGQGISVTPLQMVRYYGALINEGEVCTPHFLQKRLNDDEEPHYDRVQVFENTAAIATLNDMLETVVIDGTATDAAIEGYSVAGKTGTAEFADPEGGYVAGVYNISFIGFLPNSSSQLVCFVGATEVPGDRKVTGVFRDIMAYAIDRYKIVPSEG